MHTGLESSVFRNRFWFYKSFSSDPIFCGICAIWFQAKAIAAAEAGNEPQHEEMETSGRSGNVVRVVFKRWESQPQVPGHRTCLR